MPTTAAPTRPPHRLLGAALATVLALGAVVLVPAGPARADSVTASTAAELAVALGVTGPRTVVLGANLADATAVTTRVGTAAGSDLTLDLAGHRLEVTATDQEGALVVGSGSTLTVADSVGGGALEASATGQGAGIRVPAGSTLRLTAGTVTARGGNATATSAGGGAGIGGAGGDYTTALSAPGGADTGTILVTGGVVRASGGTGAAGGATPNGQWGAGGGGAGIGGGGELVGGATVRISGGDVTAVGGAGGPSAGTTSHGGGAGVGSGGGRDGVAVELTVSGGRLHATGGGGGVSGLPASAVGGGGGTVSAGPVRPFGQVTVSAGAEVVTEGPVVITAGSTLDNAGVLVNNGTLSGDGTLANSGTVRGSGTVSVATSSGHAYALVFDSRGGSSTPTASVYAATLDAAATTLPVPTRAGHVFMGWMAGSTVLRGDTALATLTGDGSIPLTAGWAELLLFGDAVAGQTLTTGVGSTAGPMVFFPVAYSWSVGGSPVGTSQLLLTDAMVGSTATVSGTSALPAVYGAQTAGTRSTTRIQGVYRTGSVEVSGEPQVGSTLTAGTAGTFTPAGGTLTYAWRVDGTPVAGATGPTFDLGPAHVGSSVDVTVTSSQPDYPSASVTSAAVGPVRTAPFTDVPTFTVAGRALVGETVEVVRTGEFVPAATTTYRWLADGTPVPGGTASTLTVTDGLAGTRLTVEATGTRPGFTAVTWTADAGTVQRQFTTGTVEVTGTPRVGGTLTAETASAVTPTPAATAVTWLRDGVPVPGATATTYPLTAADLGAVLAVRVTASSPTYVDATVASDPTAVVVAGSFDALPTVEIRGDALVGSVLTAVTTGAFSPASDSTTYSWWTEDGQVAGADGPELLLDDALTGRTLTVRLVATRAGYEPQTVSSPATGVVLRTFGTAIPEVAGTAQVGRTLTVAVDTAFDPAPAQIDIQWLADGRPVPGATDRTFVVAAEQTGARIEVRLTATAADHASAVTQSTPTDAVLAAPRLQVHAPDGIHPGAVLVVTGERFVSAPTFALEVHSDPVLLQQVTRTAGGGFEVRVTLPTTLPTGAHELVVVASTGEVLARLPIAVAAQPAPAAVPAPAAAAAPVATAAPALARTGAAVAAALTTSGLLVAAGAILLGAARRRRSAQV